METKELKINIPDGYEIDKENSTFEKIVFKKKENNRPRSWEEYLDKGNHPNKLWYIDPAYISTGGISSTKSDLKDFDLNKSSCYMSAYLPSKELAEAFLAIMQLMSLRHEWIHKWSIDSGMTYDWKPDWIRKINHYCINIYDNQYNVDQFCRTHHALSFPTKEIAEDFMECFKDLLEIAKPLI